jgi:hypothetical protein
MNSVFYKTYDSVLTPLTLSIWRDIYNIIGKTIYIIATPIKDLINSFVMLQTPSWHLIKYGNRAFKGVDGCKLSNCLSEVDNDKYI